MLKLPGVGTALNSFMHVSVIGHGMLELAIIYKTTNAYGVTIHKMQTTRYTRTIGIQISRI